METMDLKRILLHDKMRLWFDPLLETVKRESESIFRLLWQDPRVYASTDYNSALGLAIQYGHAIIIQMLLSHLEININSGRRCQQWNEHFERVMIVRKILSL